MPDVFNMLDRMLQSRVEINAAWLSKSMRRADEAAIRVREYRDACEPGTDDWNYYDGLMVSWLEHRNFLLNEINKGYVS